MKETWTLNDHLQSDCFTIKLSSLYYYLQLTVVEKKKENAKGLATKFIF